DLKKEDFLLRDDRREVPISTFYAGALHDTRRVTRWLVVICNEGGKGNFEASTEFAGQQSLFRPAPDHLGGGGSIRVAHLCDNGETQLDLLPSQDRDAAIRVLGETLKPIPFHTGGNSDEVGEKTFRTMIRLIIRDAHRRNPKPLPVLVSLHGDYTGQPHQEL